MKSCLRIASVQLSTVWLIQFPEYLINVSNKKSLWLAIVYYLSFPAAICGVAASQTPANDAIHIVTASKISAMDFKILLSIEPSPKTD
jgi:hypothetical protein